MEFKASAVIKAPCDQVWATLADLPNWPRWDPTCERIEGGRLAVGARLKVYSKLSPGRAFPVTVTELNPGHKMVWTGGAALKFMMKGVRLFQLTAPDSDTSKLLIKETFSGLMLPLIKGSLPDLNQAFRETLAGLKAHLES